MNQPSYTQGRQDKSLLAMTIGQAFDRTVSRFAEREALVVRHQHLRYSWAELAAAVDATAAELGATLESAQETEKLPYSTDREEEKEIDADAVFAKLKSLKSATPDEDEDDRF